MTEDWDDLCDEEKAFHEWMSTIIIKEYDIALVKKAFMDGYASGWQKRQIYTSEEQLQK